MGRVEVVVFSPGRAQLLESASAVSITPTNIPAATTERALARNLHVQNKTPEEYLRGAG